MNTKANTQLLQEAHFSITAIVDGNGKALSMLGHAITPRGVMIHCSGEQISELHNIESDGPQSKYQTLLIELNLNFKSGELLQLETSAQIQSIRRVSQTEFEVNMGFVDMVHDGYQHIARYVEDSMDTE